jgi:hypothetical protein
VSTIFHWIIGTEKLTVYLSSWQIKEHRIMNPPTNIHQHRSPAGKPEFPYLPGCTQMDAKPGSVEGWIAWGPTVDGVHQTWLGLPVSLDINQVYATMQDYGLCLNGGDPVPFVAVQEQAQETAEMPEPLRLLAEGASSPNVDQSSSMVNPNLARLAPVETQANEAQVDTPVPPAQTVGGAGWGMLSVIGLAMAGVAIYQHLENRVDVPVVAEQEPADMSPASTPVRPAVSTGTRAVTLIQQGVSLTNQNGSEVTNQNEPCHEPKRFAANRIIQYREPSFTLPRTVANQTTNH